MYMHRMIIPVLNHKQPQRHDCFNAVPSAEMGSEFCHFPLLLTDTILNYS